MENLFYGSSLTLIPGGVWMILDVQPPVMRRLYLYGALEVKFKLELVEMYLFFVISSFFISNTCK